MNKLYTADFETTTDIDDCRVWAYGICEIGNPSNFIYGNDIQGFINFCSNVDENPTLYFHNLKFDGEFIFYYLLKNGYECIKDKKDKKDKTFICLISDTGQFYSIEIYFKTTGKKVNKVTIYDSLKILNFSVDKIAKDFDLPIRKLEIDYKEKREIGHILTDIEIDYLRNDVEIMSRALNEMFSLGLTKMTIGSNALYDFKSMLSSFKDYFPILPYEIDKSCRYSYKGGWVYLNPIYSNQKINNGIVIDKNSMYPSMMIDKNLPFGNPIYYLGKYEKDILYPLYIQSITCTFNIKKNKLPTIQIKNCISSFLPTEYLESSNDELVTLVLTNIDLDLFFEHYDVDNLIYNDGYKFKQIRGLFSSYIMKWYNSKNQAKKDGNSSKYSISKVMLNSLYGKFGLNPNVRGKYPILENDIVKYKLYDSEIRDSIYCPVASFITSYARNDIIRNAQKIRDYSLKKYNEDYFIYSDTDSIHCKYLSDDELKEFMEIDDYKLGAYKKESEFDEGIFIRQKCYIEKDKNGKISTTIAGLPKKLGQYINMENFKQGFSILASDSEKEHKLMFKHVKGGVVLVDTDFTIK